MESEQNISRRQACKFLGAAAAALVTGEGLQLLADSRTAGQIEQSDQSTDSSLTFEGCAAKGYEATAVILAGLGLYSLR